jgi:integrase
VITVADPDTGRRRRVKQTAPDRPGAQRLLRQMITEREKSGRVPRKDYTVGRCLDDFLADPPASWRSPTTRRINAQLADRLRSGLGSVLVSKLTAGQVAAHLRREISGDKPLARRTVRDELALLRRALRRAEAHDLIHRNVALLADMPEGALTRRSDAMTAGQAGQLLASGLTPRMRAWLSVTIMMGLRPGEAGALSWDDIDAGTLHVRHALRETAGGLAPGDTKTEDSRRSLAMPQAVSEALAAWGAEQAEQEMIAGAEWRNDAGLIFTDGFGRPLNRQKLHREFRAACRAAGIARPDGRPFQPRELRTTFVTLMSHSGVALEVISDLVGHRNSRITREVYRRQLAGQVQPAATVMDAIFENRGSS